MAEAFVALVSGAPATGLTPTWASAYDANTGEAKTGPSITELGGGVYTFNPPSDYDLAGIIDLGATASPRYQLARADSVEVVAALAGGPLTGLSPTWSSLVDVATGGAIDQPTIEELGSGLYTFTAPRVTAHALGIIDFGATASPRYWAWETAVGQRPTPQGGAAGPAGGGLGILARS